VAECWGRLARCSGHVTALGSLARIAARVRRRRDDRGRGWRYARGVPLRWHVRVSYPPASRFEATPAPTSKTVSRYASGGIRRNGEVRASSPILRNPRRQPRRSRHGRRAPDRCGHAADGRAAAPVAEYGCEIVGPPALAQRPLLDTRRELLAPRAELIANCSPTNEPHHWPGPLTTRLGLSTAAWA
jgi:hypothetical protein